MILSKGASIYDVRTKGGRGVSPKEDVVREFAFSTVDESQMRTRGEGEGVKKSQNFADVIYGWPLSSSA